MDRSVRPTRAAGGLCLLAALACAPSREDGRAPAPDRPAPVSPTRILIVHSYSSDYAWTAGIQRGIERALAGAKDVVWEVYFMDTKRRSRPEERRQAGELALAITEEWGPDVVITSDDNAQDEFSRFLVGRDDLNVVFCGVNAAAAKYGFPAANVTGLLERPAVDRSVALLDRIAPGSSKLALLTDASPTSDGAIAWIRQQTASKRFASYLQPRTFRAWKKAVRTLNRTAEAVGLYTYHTVKDESGAPVPPREVMTWTIEHLRRPSFAMFSFAVDDGALVGYVGSAYENGLKAGMWALELARGRPLEDFPMTSAVKGQSMLNLRTAHQLGLTPSPDLLEEIDVRIRGEEGDG